MVFSIKNAMCAYYRISSDYRILTTNLFITYRYGILGVFVYLFLIYRTGNLEVLLAQLILKGR